MTKRIHQGFTLIEIAVIVAVISVIATMIVVSFNTVQRQSRDQKRTSDVAAYKTALRSYLADNNEFPPACSGPNSGCDVSNLASYLVPKYMNAIINDPTSSSTGNNYTYSWGTVNGLPSYGIFVHYELGGTCVAGMNSDPTWWWGWSQCPDGHN